MFQFFGWVATRLTCTLRGHDMETGEFYYPPAKSMTPGYIWERCGKTQLLKYRWQK